MKGREGRKGGEKKEGKKEGKKTYYQKICSVNSYVKETQTPLWHTFGCKSVGNRLRGIQVFSEPHLRQGRCSVGAVVGGQWGVGGTSTPWRCPRCKKSKIRWLNQLRRLNLKLNSHVHAPLEVPQPRCACGGEQKGILARGEDTRCASYRLSANTRRRRQETRQPARRPAGQMGHASPRESPWSKRTFARVSD